MTSQYMNKFIPFATSLLGLYQSTLKTNHPERVQSSKLYSGTVLTVLNENQSKVFTNIGLKRSQGLDYKPRQLRYLSW
jgi:hypothetical protein